MLSTAANFCARCVSIEGDRIGRGASQKFVAVSCDKLMSYVCQAVEQMTGIFAHTRCTADAELIAAASKLP